MWVHAVEVAELSKCFGPVRALRGVTLAVPEGESLVIFGPNGAGKTTLLKILATLVRPTSGRVRLFGSDPRADGRARGLIGLVSHASYLYAGLTARENLVFTARMYGVRDPEARADRMLDLVGLAGRGGDLVRTYSRGMMQRLSIARALVHDPPLLLLDEPYTGLDRSAAQTFTNLLLAMRGTRTIILTTHSIEQGVALCDRVAILVDGEVAYEGRDGLADYRAVERIYTQHVEATA